MRKIILIFTVDKPNCSVECLFLSTNLIKGNTVLLRDSSADVLRVSPSSERRF